MELGKRYLVPICECSLLATIQRVLDDTIRLLGEVLVEDVDAKMLGWGYGRGDDHIDDVWKVYQLAQMFGKLEPIGDTWTRCAFTLAHLHAHGKCATWITNTTNEVFGVIRKHYMFDDCEKLAFHFNVALGGINNQGDLENGVEVYEHFQTNAKRMLKRLRLGKTQVVGIPTWVTPEEIKAVHDISIGSTPPICRLRENQLKFEAFLFGTYRKKGNPIFLMFCCVDVLELILIDLLK